MRAPATDSMMTEAIMKYQLSTGVTVTVVFKVSITSAEMPESTASVFETMRFAVKPEPTPANPAASPASGCQIGRASCRERVWISGGGGSIKGRGRTGEQQARE